MTIKELITSLNFIVDNGYSDGDDEVCIINRTNQNMSYLSDAIVPVITGLKKNGTNMLNEEYDADILEMIFIHKDLKKN